eukprot:m.86870 g.86870  ORF g.86870 m.86870 type:complete len:332 (+) comp11499_c0_seq1:1307-2302(+)
MRTLQTCAHTKTRTHSKTHPPPTHPLQAHARGRHPPSRPTWTGRRGCCWSCWGARRRCCATSPLGEGSGRRPPPCCAALSLGSLGPTVGGGTFSATTSPSSATWPPQPSPTSPSPSPKPPPRLVVPRALHPSRPRCTSMCAGGGGAPSRRRPVGRASSGAPGARGSSTAGGAAKRPRGATTSSFAPRPTEAVRSLQCGAAPRPPNELVITVLLHVVDVYEGCRPVCKRWHTLRGPWHVHDSRRGLSCRGTITCVFSAWFTEWTGYSASLIANRSEFRAKRRRAVKCVFKLTHSSVLCVVERAECCFDKIVCDAGLLPRAETWGYRSRSGGT